MITWSVFAVWYSLRASWWKSPYGCNTMLVSLAIATAMGFDVFGTTHKIPIALYVLFVLLGIHRIYLLETAQRHREPETHMRQEALK